MLTGLRVQLKNFWEVKNTENQTVMTTKVAICQVPDIRENVEASLEWIEKFAGQAEAQGVSLICFPECFLQGYLTDKHSAERYALNLKSATSSAIFQRLAKYNLIIVFGLIEEDAGNLYNTAVVIKQGKLLGKYRKINLLRGEQTFKSGRDYSIFQINDLKFGINICYDTQFAETVASIAKQGASLILCPANNMLRNETAEEFKHFHHKIRRDRAIENRVWLLSADVTGERDGRISYGPTSAINPEGEIISQVPLMKTGMTTVSI